MDWLKRLLDVSSTTVLPSSESASPLQRACADAIAISIRLFCPDAQLPALHRLTHPYLFYVTDPRTADVIVQQRRLDSPLPFVSLGQDPTEAATMTDRQGVVLIFTSDGIHRSGGYLPQPPPNIVYHYVGPLGGRALCIAKGSTSLLKLVAVAWPGHHGQYSTSNMLDTSIDIAIAPR